MLTDPAGGSAALPETRPDSVARDKDKPRAPVEPGAWQAYLNKVLPPLPDQVTRPAS